MHAHVTPQSCFSVFVEWIIGHNRFCARSSVLEAVVPGVVVCSFQHLNSRVVSKNEQRTKLKKKKLKNFASDIFSIYPCKTRASLGVVDAALTVLLFGHVSPPSPKGALLILVVK